ncbi:MAG: glycerate kinase [bacterium]
MKNFIVAPDSFKGTMTASEVCSVIETSILKYIPDALVRKIPMADGGEGMVDAYLNICGGKRVRATVSGPFGSPMEVYYGLLPNNTAVIEMASCAGLPLVEENKNPMLTTTYGVGELILHAANMGVKNIILGLGGSATNDCGLGMAAALGYRFLNQDKMPVKHIGGSMLDVRYIEQPSHLPAVTITAACDVDNPLYGPTGAAYVFGKQKGANATMLASLDEGLKNMANIIERDLGVTIRDMPGAGAAGGLGAGVVVFSGGSLSPGIELLLDAADFDAMLKDADLVFTGEGRIDGQSAHGKVPVGVSRRAKKHHVPCIALCGSIGEGTDVLYDYGINALFSAVRGVTDLEEIKKTCHEDMRLLAENVIRTLLITPQCILS